MFKFSKEVIYIRDGAINLQREPDNQLESDIINVLSVFEEKVFSGLQSSGPFKYIQGTVKASLLFDEACKILFNPSLFFITQHPSYIGDILINKILCSENRKVYLVFVGDGMKEFWLNSHIKFNDVYSRVLALSDVATIKRNLEITCITLESSSKITVERINLGAKYPLWQLKE